MENETNPSDYRVSTNWGVRMADSVMVRTPVLGNKWAYDYGVTFKGFENLFLKTGNRIYFDFVQKSMDEFIGRDGNIRGYTLSDYNLDNINCGKSLFILYHKTGDEKYKKAAELLFSQLKKQPRTSQGGFWHKQIYPYQMWLDGLYMEAPFYAQFVKEFGNEAEFGDIARQFTVCREHMFDAESGLYYHAWDEKKVQPWCDPKTGLSENFWGRSMGWLVMAIADLLDYLPEDHKDRGSLIHMFDQALEALWKVRSPQSSVWYQVLDKPDRKGNYLESSASCMVCYAIAKGLRKGYLTSVWAPRAKMVYKGLIDEFVTLTKQGLVNLNKVCRSAGLGGQEKRDGTFEYYISEPIVTNDLKGVGSFILAASEMER